LFFFVFLCPKVPEFASSATLLDTMGLAKANELLLLGQKIDANTAVQWNICSSILDCSNHPTNDPFHPDSIGIQVCQRLEEKLFSLPLGNETSVVSNLLFFPLGFSNEFRTF